MKVLLLFDSIDMDDNNSITANTYSCGNHSLSAVKVEKPNAIHLSVENNSLFIRGNNGNEIYNGNLGNDTHLIILSHWGHQNRACSRLFFNNREISYNEHNRQSLDSTFLKGFWKRVHSAPKILVCKGRSEAMSKIIQIFSRNVNEKINKLAENLEKECYERD